ncbi:cyclophilin-like fold protein [Paucibacter sp. PLA-PC-4]|uniref:cyclophilin-like fold protein n=1 Tax=Paucibacter sp. PLA-PC-4 TaxID=2993655 RepID=UPI00224B3BC3|nr:cyclophilin-like fold protein [Paucibacter sp. PLA-PC-4]MCX2864711.1 cyclophilin-like fold protein [Paucibacter sp. PLA-PC-4]
MDRMLLALARRHAPSARTAIAVLGMALAVQTDPAESKEHARMWMTVDARRIAVKLDDSATVRALVQLLPVTLNMAELNGNEKHAKLPRRLPAAAERVGTIRCGDVLLYGDDTLVVFYETFRSGYSYTRIGRIEETAGLGAVLGSGSRRVTFSMP